MESKQKRYLKKVESASYPIVSLEALFCTLKITRQKKEMDAMMAELEKSKEDYIDAMVL